MERFVGGTRLPIALHAACLCAGHARERQRLAYQRMDRPVFFLVAEQLLGGRLPAVFENPFLWRIRV